MFRRARYLSLALTDPGRTLSAAGLRLVPGRGCLGRCAAGTIRRCSRPSRTASAAASPRVWTSSLRRIAETWWSTVLCDTTRRSAISALRMPSASSASTSSSRPVRPAGFSRVRARGRPLQPARAALAQAPCDDRGRRPSAECQQLAVRLAQRGLIVGVGQRERGIVRAALLAPQLRGPLALTGDREAVQIVDSGRGLGQKPGPPPPAGELAQAQRFLQLDRERERMVRFGRDRVRSSFQPARLRARRRSRRESLQLADPEGQVERLV